MSLGDDRVVALGAPARRQANFTMDEYHECDEALKKDPRVIAALARTASTTWTACSSTRGPTAGLLVPEKYRDRRVGWTDVWFYDEEGSNPYANPLSGLHFVVDVNTLELLEIEDSDEVDRPRTMGEYVPGWCRGSTCATTSSRSRSSSQRACRSRSRATCCAGSAGRCGSASTRARGS